MGRIRNSRKKSKRSKKKQNSTSRPLTAAANKSFASAEVVDVILNDEHPAYNLEAFIVVGAVKARQLKGEFGTPDNELQWHTPYFGTGISMPPLIGEIVLLVAAAGKKSQTDNKVTELYYLPPINIWQDPNHNQLPGSSFMVSSGTDSGAGSEAEDCNPSGQYSSNPGTVRNELPEIPLGKIFEEKNIQKLFPYEGDIITEGRHGQSIRFGSTVKNTEYPNWWSATGENGDPIIIISDGHAPTGGEFSVGDETYPNTYKMEDPNNDGAIVVLTHSQTVPIEISSVIGDSIRQDSYGNSPSNKKQDKTTIDYQEKIKEKEKNNEVSEVDDRKQEQEEEVKKEEEKEEVVEETNSNEAEVTDIVIGAHIAHKVAGRQGNDWSEDTPQDSYGKSKPNAFPREIETACSNYPSDLTGLNVILSSGLENFCGPVIIHVNEMLPAYKMTKLNYDGTFERFIQTKEIYDTLTQDLVIDKTKTKDFDINNPLDPSDWNTSQPSSNMSAYFTKTLKDYANAGEDSRGGNSILIAMDILKQRGAASIKLLGVGDYWANTLGYADRNLFLQDQADKIDICTFVGGFEQKKSGAMRGGEPKNIDAYREQINGSGAAPITTPPPTSTPTNNQDKYEEVAIHKGLKIMQEKDTSGYKGDKWDEPANYYYRLEDSFKLDPSLSSITDVQGWKDYALGKDNQSPMDYHMRSNIRSSYSEAHDYENKTFPRKDPFGEDGYVFAIKWHIDEELENWKDEQSF